MTRQKPIGSAEEAVLQWLDSNGGRWTDEDGAVWESKFWTLQLLGSLTAKGLVQEVVAGACYTLTDKGFDRFLSAEFTDGVPNPGARTYTGVSSTRNTGTSHRRHR